MPPVCVVHDQQLRRFPICPAGFRDACDAARKVLEDSSFNNHADPERFRADLINIAKTTLSSKILTVVSG